MLNNPVNFDYVRCKSCKSLTCETINSLEPKPTNTCKLWRVYS